MSATSMPAEGVRYAARCSGDGCHNTLARTFRHRPRTDDAQCVRLRCLECGAITRCPPTGVDGP